MRSETRARPRESSAIVVAAMALALLGAPVAASELPSIAVFDFELVDTSLEGEIHGASEAEQARLGLISDLLREELAATGKLRVIDGAPAADRAAPGRSLRNCQGCELEIAEELEADFALIGWVQKVSNLILNINVSIREVATGRLATGASVDIRGNTDESWARGTRNLVQHRLMAE